MIWLDSQPNEINVDSTELEAFEKEQQTKIAHNIRPFAGMCDHFKFCIQPKTQSCAVSVRTRNWISKKCARALRVYIALGSFRTACNYFLVITTCSYTSTSTRAAEPRALHKYGRVFTALTFPHNTTQDYSRCQISYVQPLTTTITATTTASPTTCTTAPFWFARLLMRDCALFYGISGAIYVFGCYFGCVMLSGIQWAQCGSSVLPVCVSAIPIEMQFQRNHLCLHKYFMPQLTHSHTHRPTTYVHRTHLAHGRRSRRRRRRRRRREPKIIFFFSYSALSREHIACEETGERESGKRPDTSEQCVRGKTFSALHPHMSSNIYIMPKYMRYSRRHLIGTQSNLWTFASRSTHAGVWERECVWA